MKANEIKIALSKNDPNLKNKHNQVKTLLNSNVSAFIELPIGVHTIADKKYTVVEAIREEGTDNEYRYNVIELIEPATAEAQV